MTTQLLNDRYKIIQPLGSGGFGETFLAEDIQMPSKRRCVIKQLKPIAGNAQAHQLVKERFEREAAVLERLGEGNRQIPRLYAYFESAGQFYLVQEWIEGVTLTNKVRSEGLLSESAVKKILIEILPVLDYVHKQQLVHRDIKPDNIILRQRDGLPVLIDFGAVKEAMGTVVNSEGNSTASIVIGTPGFMSAEQAAGRPLYSSDLYSLGLTAIYLLSGKIPQELETDPSTGEILWHRHASNVSPGLAAVLDKAILSHPRDRTSSAGEMLAALNSGSANVPMTQATVAVAPPHVQTVQPPAKRSDRPNPLLIVGSSIGVAIIVAGVVLSQQLARSPEPVEEQPVSSPERSQPYERSQVPNNPPPTRSETPVPASQQIPPGSPPEIKEPESVPSPLPRSQASEPSPVYPKPQPTSSQTPVPLRESQSSPEQAVKNYYSTINNRNYQAAWDQLSTGFKSQNNFDFNGAFRSWWETVAKVDVDYVSPIKKNTQTATLDVKLTYSMKSGKISSEVRRFVLVWDANSGRWIIDEANFR